MHLRRRRVFYIKFGFGLVLLLALLIWQGPAVVDQLRFIRPWLLVPFLGISLVTIGISCIKWRLFVREQGGEVSFARLFGYYLVGSFFNHFLPTNFGGDVVRSYVLGRHTGSQSRSAATVFLERLTGLIALLVLAVVSYTASPSLRREPLIAATIAGATGALATLVAALCWPQKVVSVFRPLRRLSGYDKTLSRLWTLRDNILLVRHRPGLIAKAMAWSFVFHFGTAVNVWITALTIGVHANLLAMLTLTPIILLVVALPLTPNSVGLWEWTFSLYLGTAGMDPSQGLLIALMLRAKTLLISLAGGVVFMWEGRGTAQTSGTDLPDGSPPPGIDGS